jgi:hypothetical protein
LASRAKENEQRKGRPSLSLSEFLDIAARHRTRVPSFIPSIGGLSSNDVNSHKETPGNSTRLYNNLWWRVERTRINPDPKVNPERDDLVIAVDSTGIKVTKRGQWMLDKWKKKRKRKGFIKIHVAVNTKTKKIVSMEVTKENVHDGKMLKRLVDDVISKNNRIKKILADGAMTPNTTSSISMN